MHFSIFLSINLFFETADAVSQTDITSQPRGFRYTTISPDFHIEKPTCTFFPLGPSTVNFQKSIAICREICYNKNAVRLYRSDVMISLLGASRIARRFFDFFKNFFKKERKEK